MDNNINRLYSTGSLPRSSNVDPKAVHKNQEDIPPFSQPDGVDLGTQGHVVVERGIAGTEPKGHVVLERGIAGTEPKGHVVVERGIASTEPKGHVVVERGQLGQEKVAHLGVLAEMD